MQDLEGFSHTEDWVWKKEGTIHQG